MFYNCTVIGASSEPHTSMFYCNLYIYIYIYILGECSALWGEPERVAWCIILVFHRKCLGKRLGHRADLGLIVHTVLGVSIITGVGYRVERWV